MVEPAIPTVGTPHMQRSAMRLSLGVGFFMLASKMLAYAITGSAAILSDAAESVVHVVAVSFAAFSLWVSADPRIAAIFTVTTRSAFSLPALKGP